MDRVDIINGTLAKGFGVMGGYIAASQRLLRCDPLLCAGLHFHDLLGARPLPPARWPRSATSSAQRSSSAPVIASASTRSRAMMAEAGLPVMDNPSHIVPVMVGDPVHCKAVTDTLLTHYGIYVQPINYPTVPRGTERMRLTPSPVH